MTSVDPARAVTGGVDTHLDLNVAAAVDHIGGLLGVAEFPTTSSGHKELVAWLKTFGPVAKVGIEGTSSYGAGLARSLRRALVFDAGQNSEGNYDLLDSLPFHFVGSLPPSDHPDLLAVGKAGYRPVDEQRFPGLAAYESEKVVFGQRRRVVLTHSDDLHAKQCVDFDQTLAKARRQLDSLQARLARGQTKKAKDKVEAEVAEILKPRWLSRVVSVSLSGEEPSDLRLSYRTNAKARAALEEEIFGKRVLFSDKGPELASTAQVVADYRSQEAAEGDFRQMKDPKVVSFSPMFHWTEQKIRVHVFYCVLALMAARLMTRQAERAGLAMSVRELLGALAEVQETVLLYQGERGRPRARRVTTEMSVTQQRLFELFGLGAYAPARP